MATISASRPVKGELGISETPSMLIATTQ